jgi:hypothetical protein
MEKPAASQSEDVSRAQRRMLTAQVILTRAASSGKERLFGAIPARCASGYLIHRPTLDLQAVPDLSPGRIR